MLWIRSLPSAPNSDNRGFSNSSRFFFCPTLVFEDYNVLDSVFYDTSNLQNQNVVLEKDAKRICLDIVELLKEFEVLRMDKIQEDATSKVYEFLGNALYNNRADFGMFRLKFKNVYVCWNELESDAWFVGWNK